MEIVEFLQNQLMFDYKVFTEKLWIYYWAMIPAGAYFCFFAIKWAIFTLPFWMPLYLALSVLRHRE